MSAALAKIERAERAVDDLCSGRLRWEMRVPAEPDHDPDLIISDALSAARGLLAENERLRSELMVMRPVHESLVRAGRDLLARFPIATEEDPHAAA